MARCERVVGERVEVENDPARRRAVDRSELVADGAVLRRLTGWAPWWTLDETLAELLSERRRA